MTILTNDPSLTKWGWAVLLLKSGRSRILESGCIKTQNMSKKKNIYKADDRARRIGIIASKLVDLHQKHDLDWIVSEIVHGSQSYHAAVNVGMTPGILCTFGACFDLPVEWYSEGDAKKHLSGKRKLSKADTIAAVKEIYGSRWITLTNYVDEAVADSLAVFHLARETSQALIYAANQK